MSAEPHSPPRAADPASLAGEALPSTLSLSEAGAVPSDVPPASVPPTRALPPAGDATAATVLPAPPPRRRLEHYEILLREDGHTLWELGRGAMGVTYKALDTRLRCHVALKVINADLLDRHPALRERFLREARAAARLRHTNVASVFHLGEGGAGPGDGPCFYAMEFIGGETLESRVRRRGPLPAALAVEVAVQVARALVAASQQGLIHRDLKPANLMLVSDEGAEPGAGSGEAGADGGGLLVKVIDFGLAKAITDGGDLTAVNAFVGTPQFASPEQVAGSGDRDGGSAPVDARADIYSLGVTLWYALTGKVPFPGRNLSEIHGRQLSPPPLSQVRLAGAPPPVVELLESMLAPAPADRPQTPYALLEALRACRAALRSTASPAATAVGGREATGRGTSAGGFVSPLAQRRERQRRLRRRFAAAAGLVLLLPLAGWMGGGWLLRRRGEASRPGQPVAAAAERSLAVLPFDNLSAEPDNAFLADGLQDDLLASLANVAGLRVIARSSVQHLRGAGARGDLRQVARSLNVAHLLTGTVRRAGGRVRIGVELVEAATGRQVWAKNYDGDLHDVLGLQGELAGRIADALHATLSPQEVARVAGRPTADAEAHILYQRGREYQNRLGFRLEDLRSAEGLFAQAVARDPAFALAHAQLSVVRSRMCHNYGPAAARREQAHEAAETARRLAPDGGEGWLARGLCTYWHERDFPRALEEFARATRALPNSPDPVFFTAAIHRRQGRWEESRAGFERARTLDPVNPAILQELANVAWATRDWATARRHYDRLVALAPDDVSLRLWRARIPLREEGRTGPLRAVLSAVPAGVDPEGEVTLTRFEAAMIERDLDAAARALDGYAGEVFPAQFEVLVHKRYLRGLVHLARGGAEELAAARECFEAARPTYEAAVRESPNDAFQRANLGQLYAALGRREAAVAEGERAVALVPEASDAIDGPTMQLRLARIYARLGDADRALPILERLLTIPVWEGFTVHELRLRPEWDGLRGNARFAGLLTGAPVKAR